MSNGLRHIQRQAGAGDKGLLELHEFLLKRWGMDLLAVR